MEQRKIRGGRAANHVDISRSINRKAFCLVRTLTAEGCEQGYVASGIELADESVIERGGNCPAASHVSVPYGIRFQGGHMIWERVTDISRIVRGSQRQDAREEEKLPRRVQTEPPGSRQNLF